MRIHKRLIDIVEPDAEDDRLAAAHRAARPASTSRSRSSRRRSRAIRSTGGGAAPPDEKQHDQHRHRQRHQALGHRGAGGARGRCRWPRAGGVDGRGRATAGWRAGAVTAWGEPSGESGEAGTGRGRCGCRGAGDLGDSDGASAPPAIRTASAVVSTASAALAPMATTRTWSTRTVVSRQSTNWSSSLAAHVGEHAAAELGDPAGDGRGRCRR